ncbi:hypothetical protein PC119_g13737 [Phytophthora cactorum]|nr:hypothetical protein PC119_g13737 [Phytophthora cactorum]
MSPANNYTGWDEETIVKLAEALYSDDFNEHKDLRDKIDRFSGGTTVDLYRLVALICVLPVTTAGTDRSFSTMKRIKTRLRTSMGDAWMSNLMIIAIERGLTNQIDKNEVIDAFSSMTKRRIPM